MYKGSCWCERHVFPRNCWPGAGGASKPRVYLPGLFGGGLAARPVLRPGPDDAYVDPRTGLQVFTSDYLRRRGYCCGSGCRHCPWDPNPDVAIAPPVFRFASVVPHRTSVDRTCRSGALGVQGAVFTENLLPILQTGAGTVTERRNCTDGLPELKSLEVTWDSLKPEAFFAHPLGVTCGAGMHSHLDSTSYLRMRPAGCVLRGRAPCRSPLVCWIWGVPGALSARGGRAFDLVEFNWFPQGSFRDSGSWIPRCRLLSSPRPVALRPVSRFRSSWRAHPPDSL